MASKSYVTNEELHEAIVEAKQEGRLTDRLARHIMAIAENFSHHAWYRGYGYREDLVGEAIVKLTKNWAMFDPEKSPNPFAYYTRICQNVFTEHISNQRKEADIVDELHVEADLSPSEGFEARQASNSAWSKDRTRLQALRKKDQAQAKKKAEGKQPDRGALPWKPNHPAAFTFELSPHHSELTELQLIQIAHDQCNAINIVPEELLFTHKGKVIASVPWNPALRIAPMRRK